MADIFISYARSTTATQARAAAAALRSLGYSVWMDEEAPAHRAFADVIAEQISAAKAVLVIWSQEAVASQWVRSEASRGRRAGKLVQLSVDQCSLPMPFDQIQCARLPGWTGEGEAPGWRRVVDSVGELVTSIDGSEPANPPRPAATTVDRPSIAVLPFSSVSPDQRDFAEGVSDEVVDALSRFKSFFVVEGRAPPGLGGAAVNPSEFARRVGVRYVLEGSVRRAADRLRIAVKLVEAAGAQIWGGHFEDTLEDVFAAQDRVALSVAAVIEPAIRAAEFQRVSKIPTEDMSAYDLYVQASGLIYTFNRRKGDMLRALMLLERALDLEPDYAMALAAAADCHRMIIQFGWTDDPEHHRRIGLERADQAQRIGAEDADVLFYVASSLMGPSDRLDRAIAVVDHALLLNPGSARIWRLSGLIRTRVGDPALAIDHLERGLRLDPHAFRSGGMRMLMAVARFEQSRFDEALSLFRQTPGRSPLGHAVEAALLGHLGHLAEAQDALSRYRDASDTPIERAALNYFRRPEHQKLFLEGVALAEGEPDIEVTPRDDGAQSTIH